MDNANIIRLNATDGTPISFVDHVIAQGAMKDVYFSEDKTYVVGFFRNDLDANAKQRIENIVNIYRKKIFEQEGGDYWEDLFCWPTHIVEWEGKTGIVCPTYKDHFYFSEGNFAGKEKEGKWFASAKLRNKYLCDIDIGNWRTHMMMCLQIARAVRRLHAAGLAHSDLSYKNVLVDPILGKATIIDIDGLVIAGKYIADVAGTPDFIAPEVMETRSLKVSDPNKKLPDIYTDRHALSVLIYMYLLYRHPLRGGKVHDLEPAKDEELSMGKKALFIEDPKDNSNRPKLDQISPHELPQADIDKLPYTICGPYIKELFDKAFIHGLHEPKERPSAADWEQALQKTIDLLIPCSNKDCSYKYFVYDNSLHPTCPFCGTPLNKPLAIVNLYYSPKKGIFKPENYRLIISHKQNLFKWHVNRFINPNEKLKPEDKDPVGKFSYNQGKWWLKNISLDDLHDHLLKKKIEIGDKVELSDGKNIILSNQNGGRLAMIQIVKNKQ